MKKILFLLTGLMFVLASCSDGGSDSPDNPTPQPNPTPEETASITIDSSITSNGVDFDAKGGEKTVSFSANKDWTLSVATPTNGTVWCTPSATNGVKGDATVKFIVKENSDYDDRSVSVTIKAGTASKTFTITQKGVDALLVTSTKFEVPQEGGSIEVEVKANISYELQISETAKSWISEAKSRALTTKKHAFTIAASEEYEKREGEIHIKSGDKLEIVKVYQAGGAILMLSKNDCSVSSEGETISVDIKSNIEYGVQMPNVDWITDAPASRAASSHTLKYVVLPNETPDARSAEIIFYDKNSSLKDTLKVVQAQKDAIIISKKEYEVKAEGETLEVKLSANVDFEVTMPEVDWVSQVTARALTEHSLYFKVSENKNNDGRNAEIVITNKDSQLSEKITIFQQGATLLKLTQDEYTISDAGETISVELKSNVEYGIQMPEVDWITSDVTARSVSTESLKFDIAPNETYDSRSAEIIFYDKNSSLKDTLKVVQAQKDAIIISKKEYEVKAEGETIEIKLSANVDFEVTMPEVDWVSQVTARSLTEHTLNLEIAKNEGKEKRSTEIIFKDKNSQLSDKLTINQLGSLEEGYADGVVTVATAGTMKKLLGDDYLNITSLKVVGFINGDDVYYLRKMLGGSDFSVADRGILATLDLSEATIVEGGEWYCDTEIYSLNLGKLYTTNNKVGDYMFYSCSNLKDIILPNNVTTVGSYAFGECGQVNSVILGKNIKSIEKGAYYNCSALKSIDFSNSITDIGQSAFAKCNSLKAISIEGNGATKIGHNAFGECKSLIQATIGDGVISLGDYLFSGCYNLKEVSIGNRISIIPYKLFEYCKNLKIISFGSGVEIFEEMVFGYDTKDFFLEAVYIHDLAAWCQIDCPDSRSLPLLRGYADLFVNNVLLTELTIPQGVTEVGNMFSGCKSLKKLIIPEGVLSVGSFNDCYSLMNVEISNGLNSLGSFRNCKLLSKIVIPNSVKSVGSFSGCGSLTEAKLGNGIVSICDFMFSGCNSLTKVTIGENLEDIGEKAFASTNIKEFYSYAINPPKLTYGGSSSMLSYTSFASFPELLEEAKLYVPNRCSSEYRKSGWGTRYDRYSDYFINIIEMD